MNINNFMDVAKNYALNPQSDAMIVKDGQDGTTSAGRLGNKVTRFFRNLFGVGKEQHAAIRRDLAQALSSEYGGARKIPKNVLRALKLDDAQDVPLDAEGNLKLGSTPLTARRIVAVANAVSLNRRVAEMTTKINACFARAAQADEDFAIDYGNPRKAIRYNLNELAASMARTFVGTKPEAFSGEAVRTFVMDRFAALGYRVTGESSSFGLNGAAPKPEVMDALLDDLVDAVAPPVVQRNRESAVNQFVRWCQDERTHLTKQISVLEKQVAELKTQEKTGDVAYKLVNAETHLQDARTSLAALKEQCGETPDAQKAWAKRFLSKSPSLKKYLNTSLSPAKLDELRGRYVDTLRESLREGMKLFSQAKKNGFSGNFLREIAEWRIDLITINGTTPRRVRNNPGVDLGAEQAGHLASYAGSERIKALVEQLAEVVPDEGVRQFVTSAISENGFVMMLNMELMNTTHHAVNDAYAGNMLADSLMIGGPNLVETKIDLNVDQTTGAVDIRLRGGPSVSYIGKNPLGTDGMTQPLFHIPFEAHITIPGGQHVQPGEMPQITASIDVARE